MKKKSLILGIACAALVAACSSSSGSGEDAGSDAAVVNGCTAYTDMTTGTAVINGPATAAAAQYSPNCIHVKVGQSVTWNSDFADHPLVAFGGDSPNPIQSTATGTTVTFAFPNAGTFGYHCGIHTTLMFGAVEVTP